MDIKIIKYDESYAGRVADMWNHSIDGWGGANTVNTTETVLHQESNSTNIHTFLAMEGEKVVGYCGLSEYREDEGALYIPLLNVRDDYHGKKIGKKLLLTALEETIDLKWPRLDLYTWPGNTKAVPLYKKCGFFWEERDDTTHLMNFIPTVLHTEAVEDFFVNASWYDCSTRKIEVKPDGRVENDFHYYEYLWKKENATLRMEFERTGRGIRLIETDDYLISATVEDHQLVFGDTYTVRYMIKNKSGKELQVDLNGMNDKNVLFSMEESVNVTDTKEVVGTFYVEEMDEEQNSFRTHPSVKSALRINGKEAIFTVGIHPKYPAQVTAHLPEDLTFIGKESNFYVDLMNNFNENIHFVMEFPKSSLLDIKNSKLNIEIQPKERVSVPISFIANDNGFYHATLSIKAVKKNGEEIHFTKEIGLALRGIGAKFHGEDEMKIQLFNGQYFTSIEKQSNVVFAGRKKHMDTIMLRAPKLGKPYSEEISRAKPTAKVFFTGTGFIGTKLTYEITAFPSIQLHVILKLFGEGLVETYYEVENKLDVPTEQEIWLTQGIFLNLDKATLPYQGKLVEMNDSIGNYYEHWDDRKLTENWIFVNNQQQPLGITWNEKDKIHFDEWYSYLEHQFGHIPGNQTFQTNPVFLSVGAFHDVDSFRAFALQKFSTENEKTVNPFTISLQNENPFVIGDQVVCKVTDYKSNYLHGQAAISLGQEEVSTIFKREEKRTEWLTEIPLHNAPLVSTVKVKAKLDAAVVERETLIIPYSDGNWKEEVLNDHGFDIWTVDNGIFHFKAAPDFYPSVYSLSYNGQEWLDHSFPTLQPKAWWNPWPGGLTSGLAEIRPYSLTKEDSIASFATLTDNKGNKWRGIKISTSIKESKENKGLVYHQYFLTLPGAPILCQVTEIQQTTGKYFNGKGWQSSAFFKPSIHMEDNWMNFQDQAGHWTKLVAGKDENDFSVERNVIIGSDNREEQLQVIANSKQTIREAYISKEVLLTGVEEILNIPTGTTRFTTPNFYTFSKTIIPDNAQHDIQQIKFN